MCIELSMQRIENNVNSLCVIKFNFELIRKFHNQAMSPFVELQRVWNFDYLFGNDDELEK